MDINIPTGQSDAVLWSIIIGFFAPVVLDLIMQSRWSARSQALVAFLFSAVAGTITAWFADAFNGVGISTTILLILVVTISTYRGFWKQVVPKLKSVTSLVDEEDKKPKH